MQKFNLTSKELIEKVQVIEEKLISEIKIEGKRQSTIDAKMEVAKKEAHIEAIVEAILQLAEEGAVVTPLGTVEVKDIPAHKGRNPRTKEEIDIPASRKIKISSNSLTKKRFK